ncbi:MAG: hypothetical protein JWQ95_7 [Sphaerisporangium sp.]|jgi:hypothetical protein|nr:hypothetical protein [Sphaerisporangium sp.]
MTSGMRTCGSGAPFWPRTRNWRRWSRTLRGRNSGLWRHTSRSWWEIGYLTNNAGHLRYDQALEAGWPIATGVIEGASRHLIADRFDLAGARWGLPGAEAVLKLRALTANGHLDAYWRYHLARQHDRVQQIRYQEGYALST